MNTSIRTVIVDDNTVAVNNLKKYFNQNERVKIVASFSNGEEALEYLINHNILTELELDIVKRGRNNSRSFHPKNTDILTYKKATGFEALIGYLYLNDKDRLNEILGYVEVI